MIKKRAVLILLSIMAVATMLLGCDKKIYITTGLKDTEAFKISGEACRLSEVLLVLMTEKSRYENELGKDIWSAVSENATNTLEDEIKLKVKNEMIELKRIHTFAENQNVALSEEEKSNISNAATEYFATLTDEQKTLLNVTLGDVESLYTSFYMAEKVYSKLTEDVKVEISDEEARVIEVNYIFIATCKLDENGNKIAYTDEELTAAKEKLAKIQELLNVGNDFVTLAEQYSESKEYSRVFARGEMVENFEKKAFELKQGETSQAIQTDDGYYFIYCVSDYLVSETNDKKTEMENNARKQAYEEAYTPFKNEQTLEFNNSQWDKITLAEYETVTTSQLYTIYNKWMNK